MGFTRDPPFQMGPRQTSKWRCGPVEFPVDPTPPRRWPRPTDWPVPTLSDDMWLYVVYSPEPCEIQTW